MIVVLVAFGLLTVIGGGVLALNSPLGWGSVGIIAAGLTSSMAWFFAAVLLGRLDEIREVIAKNRGERIDQVVVFTPQEHDSSAAFLRLRLKERKEFLARYQSLAEAVEGEWGRINLICRRSESLHHSVDEALSYAKKNGLKGTLYTLTPAHVNEVLEGLLPHLAG